MASSTHLAEELVAWVAPLLEGTPFFCHVVPNSWVRGHEDLRQHVFASFSNTYQRPPYEDPRVTSWLVLITDEVHYRNGALHRYHVHVQLTATATQLRLYRNNRSRVLSPTPAVWQRAVERAVLEALARHAAREASA